MLFLQAYANSYGGTGGETFGPESPYFPFGNTPRRPPATGKQGNFLVRRHVVEGKLLVCHFKVMGVQDGEGGRVKARCTLQQVTKAQRGNRVAALLFL